jgi:hypothetical protein
MQINYYHKKQYLEIPPNTAKFLDFDYLYDQPVSTDMTSDNSVYLNTWIEDVTDVKQGKYDNTNPQRRPFTHFTKLPYMFVELSEDRCYKFPMLCATSGSLQIETGSRMLILTQYFPQLTWDTVRFKVNNNVSQDINPLVDAILQNNYWKNHKNKFNVARALLHIETAPGLTCNHNELFYSVCQIDFTNHTPWVFGKDWTTGVDYLEYYNNYSVITEKISRTIRLWDSMREIIKNYPTNSVNDYKRLLDIIVFDNIDFVKKWREDFL